MDRNGGPNFGLHINPGSPDNECSPTGHRKALTRLLV